MQFVAERRIENGLQFVTQFLPQFSRLPLYKERLQILPKLLKISEKQALLGNRILTFNMFSNSMCKILHISEHFLKYDGVITMIRVATHNGFIYKQIAVFQKRVVTLQAIEQRNRYGYDKRA